MAPTSETPAAQTTRLLSVDALRGFDMFWLLGGEQIVHGLCAGAAAGTFAHALDEQFEHVSWAGLHFYDFIFPLFLFLIGVAIPLSVDKRLARGDSRGKILGHGILRFLAMVFIGFFTTGNMLSWNIEAMRLSYSVLMMLGFGYLIALVLVLYTSLRGQIFATAIILIGYWAVQMFIPVPGHHPGEFEKGAIFGDWLYDLSLGRLGKPWKSMYGRGWPINLWPHGATAMQGVFAARILRSEASDTRKLRWLLWLGGGCLVAGLLWSLHFPIVKNRWTSSYVLVCGGLSYGLLALFWWVIDVRGWRRGLGLWLAIGANSILAYVLAAVVMGPVVKFARRIFEKLFHAPDGTVENLMIILLGYGLAWAALIWMRHRKIFLRL